MAADVRPAPIAPELFTLLESSELHVVEDTKKVIHENLSSNRESWLVNSLVDYYYLSHSRQVLEILKEIREPHDKHLLEKLNEGIKSEQHQLYALQFLLQVVVEHPPWCRRITNASVFRALVKCLRTETDIPVLMTAVTIITIVLPSLPTVIAPFLQDIFEIFHRLVAFCVKKPGNVPDVYLLHLRVSVYSLFHRLYGMYPYNFLTYLRQCYNKKENLAVFEEVVKSMLERVRLHPNLITGTKESEIAPQRWRAMETHDVLVECAKLSLDLIEGTWEELHCPFTSLRYNSQIPMTSNEAGAAIVTTPTGIGASLDNSSASSEPLKLLQSPFTPLSMRIDSSCLWSPSEIVGLSTPPPSQLTTPSSVTDTSASSLPQLQGLPVLTPGHSTINTPRESSPIIDESDKIMSRTASRGSLRGKGGDPQQRNFDLNLSSSQASSTFTQLFPGDPHGMFSTPQSPLKKEFTSTPPIGIIKTKPVLQAAREINFNKPPGLFYESPASERRQSLEGVQKTQGSLEMTNNAESLNSSAIKGDSKETKESACQQEGNRAFEDSNEHGKPDHIGSDQMKLISSELASNSYKNDTLSVDTLPHVIEDLEHHQEDCEDDEVSELTKFEGPAGVSGSQHMITAESVAKFMKKINRIRFNSLTATNNINSLVTQGKGNLCKRSRSCPHLRKMSSTEEEDEDDDDDNELSHSLSTMNFPPSSSMTFDSKKENIVLTEGVQVVHDSESNNQNDAGIVTACTSTAAVKTATLTSTVEPEVSMKTIDSKVVNNPNGTAQSTSVMTTDEDYLQLLKQLLTPLSVTGVEVPLFSTFSPSELLDRHLLLGSEIHDKELTKMSITSSCTVNWTHFGGVPPADEVNILRGQILLMHNQLMYERHKRDQHAKRNRRLLRKITHAKSVEEQNATLRDQMRMHENTIRDLQVSLKLLHSDNRRLKDNIDSDEYQRQLQLKNCLQENQSLKAQKEELNTLLVRQREEEESLRKKLQNAESQLFNTEKELEHMKEQAALNMKLKEQVFQLHKELLLMGELQQKCQEKLQSMKPSIRSKQEHESLINSLKAETKVLKTRLESKSVNLKVCKARILELEEEIKNKENSLLELKRKLEMAKFGHNEEIQCVEEKHQCLMRINQQLGSQILNLYSEIENLRTGNVRQAKRKLGAGDHQKHSSIEQTSFDSSSDQTMREPLARITSPSERLSGTVANSVTGDSLGSSESQGHFGGCQRDGGSQLAGSLELPGIMNPPFLERQTGAERTLSSSSLSRYSNIGPSIRQPGLFDTDSEDNQSALSTRGNTVTDSGYNG